ncbi:hypothetical protein ScPMuIL_003335 [Solemya velum]
MADVVSAGNGKSVYWSNMGDVESSEGSDAIVPGVNAPGNRRPTRIRARKTKEVHAKIPLKQPVVQDLTPSKQPLQEVHVQTSKNNKHIRRPSLKDLCIEDKTRIASLIKELARVGDEREVAVGQLHHERKRYEDQLLQLVNQQEQILQEREDVQNKLFECQNLLTKYQGELLTKQEKLKASIVTRKDQTTQYSMLKEKEKEQWQPSYRTSSQSSDIDSDNNNAFTKLPPKQSVSERPQLLNGEEDCAPRRHNSKSTKPVTSSIDREIERQKSADSREQSKENSPRTPPRTPPVQKKNNQMPIKNVPINRFREPVMSSTQKSSDIMSFIPQDANSEILRMDDRCDSPLSSVREQSPRGYEQDEKQLRGRVIFKEGLEMDNNIAEKHSPNLHKGMSGVYGDQEFMNYYRKLSPNARRRELLKQRERLLDEQNRLRQVLLDQEEQLHLRQEQLERKQNEQKKRLERFEQRIDLSPAVGECKEVNSPCEALLIPKSQMHVCDEEENSIAHDINIGSPKVHSHLSVATSPAGNFPVNKVSMATSPVQMSSPDVELNGFSPRLVDVATSISYRSQRLTAFMNDMDRQGNLPLMSNRQKSSPAVPSSTTPGEKTLSVVEIVNSLDEKPIQLDGSYLENPFSPSHARGSPKKNYSSPQQANISHDNSGNDEAEESQILEDVFFLK